MRSKAWRVAIFLFFAAGLNYADRTALSSVIPPLREEIGITDAQVGIVGMLFLWSYALMSPFAGNVADRFSRSKIITWSLAGWSLIALGTGFVQSVTALFILRTLLGVVESFYLPASGALLGDHHGQATRGKAMGLHMLGLNLGLIAGGSIAGYMAEYFGWHLGFFLLGGLGILLALLAPYFLSDVEVPSEKEPIRKAASVTRAAWQYCLRTPSFYCMLASAMAAGIATWIFLTWLPLFFVENYKMGLGAAGVMGVMLYKSPVFAGVAVGGWFSDYVARRNIRGRILIKGVTLLASAPFLAIFLEAPGFKWVAVALVISSLIAAIGIPSDHPVICDMIPSQYRSTAIGIFNTCGTAAGGVGVLYAGFLKKNIGLGMVFGISSIIYALAGAVLLVAYGLFMQRDMERAIQCEENPERAI